MRRMAITMLTVVALVAPATAAADDCTSRGHPGAQLGVKILGHEARRNVQVYATAQALSASEPVVVTVARSRHRSFTRAYRYTGGQLQVHFRLARGERARVTVAYGEDWSREVFDRTGTEFGPAIEITQELIDALGSVGIDTSGLVAGTTVRDEIPTFTQRHVEDRCGRVQVRRAAR